MNARTRCACDCTLVSMHNLQLTIGARNRRRLRNRTPQAYQCVLQLRSADVSVCLRCRSVCRSVSVGLARSVPVVFCALREARWMTIAHN